MKIKASAKINLALDVLKKDPSGYHVIQTVYHEIKDLYDKIEIVTSKKKDVLPNFIPLKVKTATGIQQSEDMIVKALNLLRQTFKIKKFVKIKVVKKIPFASGLGGGSSDAAAVLKGLNKLWKLKLSKKQLANLGAKLGMDVPFFIYGGTAIGKHYGEKITPLPEIKNIQFKIYLPKTKPAKRKTEEAYGKLNLRDCGKNLSKTKSLLKGITTKNTKLTLENLHNDFETMLKKPLLKGRHFSGSGPTTFTARVAS
jgi:4-diphosphocytidyl-2-C-methyl-D-erythritol kinase